MTETWAQLGTLLELLSSKCIPSQGDNPPGSLEIQADQIPSQIRHRKQLKWKQKSCFFR